jgi:hypothetical protein
MLIDLSPERIVEFAETERFRIFFSKKSRKFGHLDGYTYFSICRSGETPHQIKFVHEYRRKIGQLTVRIYSDNPLNNQELKLITTNPFRYIDEHPFRH